VESKGDLEDNDYEKSLEGFRKKGLLK